MEKNVELRPTVQLNGQGSITYEVTLITYVMN